MGDTLPGNSGVCAMSHVAAACVPGYAPAPVLRPGMEAMIVPRLDRARSRSHATVTAAQVNQTSLLSIFIIQLSYTVPRDTGL